MAGWRWAWGLVGAGVLLTAATASAQGSSSPDDPGLGDVPPPPAGNTAPPPPNGTAPPPASQPQQQPRRMRTVEPPPRQASGPAARTHEVNVGFSIATAWGGGKRLEPADAREALFDFGLRADMIFSPGDRTKVWGIGPAFDLHSADFDTLQVGGGLQLRVRLGEVFDLWWTAGLARSVVPNARDGGLLFSTFAIGGRYRGRDECFAPVCYEPRVGAYVTYREGFIGDNEVRTVTGGLEVDISLAAFALAAL